MAQSEKFRTVKWELICFIEVTPLDYLCETFLCDSVAVWGVQGSKVSGKISHDESDGGADPLSFEHG